MRVVCIKQTKKLVKGFEYNLSALNNSAATAGKARSGKAFIDKIGWYSVSNFQTIDGEELPKLDIIRTTFDEKRLEFSDLSKGDILICYSDNYKSLIKGGMYKIESLHTITRTINRWSGGTYTQVDNYLKFEGVSRKLMFCSWKFKKLPTDQAREMVLEQILHDSPDKVTRTDFRNMRKIEHLENKDSILINILSKSILDENRHQLSITEWAVKQLGGKMDLEISDYSHLMDMKLADVLKLIDK